MKRSVMTSFAALLLGSGVLAQTQPYRDMPGTEARSQPAAEQPSPARDSRLPACRGEKPAFPAQAQAAPEPEPGKMHPAQHMPANLSGVQEPENPGRRTGSNPPVPDLLEAAAARPAKALDEFEALALENNPTVKQAEAIARVSAALARQAGLWPNPSVGYQGEQIRGGSFGGGEQGAFAQQNIVLGGKLRLRRDVFEQQRKADELGVEEQQTSVRGAVQVQFYSALAQLRVVEVHRELLAIAMDAATTAHQLANVGQADAADVLEAELEAEQAKLGFLRAQREYIRSYRELAALAGDPQMPVALLKGTLDNPPAIDPDRYLEDLLENSPSLKRAQQQARRAEAELARDKHEAMPDLMVRAGFEQNQELNAFSMQPVGLQGFATASIQLPIFNRNQGNVQASKAQVERGQEEVERIRLRLVDFAQPLLEHYLTSRLDEERYRTELLPRARRAYELYLGKYRSMAAAYPEVIISERTLFQLEDSYARTLGELWTSVVQLENYLLADGVSAPPPSGSMSTQVNLPNSGGRGAD